MRTTEINDPVEIFAGTNWEAGMVMSLLEDSEIKSFMKDEIMGTLNPWWTSPGGAGAIKVFVAKGDFNRAVEIVREYENNHK